MKSDWSTEQLSVVSSVVGNENTFIQGSAGCGKTYLIKNHPRILSHLKGKKVLWMSFTNQAAVNLSQDNGKTISSQFDIGDNTESNEGYI